MTAPPFRANARNFFLTYPHCSLDEDELPYLVPFFESITATSELVYYTIARELHADGTPHIHVVLTYSNLVDIRNSNAFDITDNTGAIRHCNIATPPARSSQGWLEQKVKYSKKDGAFISTHPTKLESVERRWFNLLPTLRNAPSENDALDAVAAVCPRDAVLYHDNICSFWRKVHSRFTLSEPYTNFSIPDDIALWVGNNLTVRIITMKPLRGPIHAPPLSPPPGGCSGSPFSFHSNSAP